MNLNYINDSKIKLVKSQLSPKRFLHTMNVIKIGIELAEIYNENINETFLACLFHDYAKEWSNEALIEYSMVNQLNIDQLHYKYPYLLHGPVAAHYCMKKNYINSRIAKAIAYHTTGNSGLDTLGKIVYLADAIEIGRTYPNVEYFRKLSKVNLNEALYEVVTHTITYLEKNNSPIHPNSIKMKHELKEMER